jgi:hypothetical protein
MATELVQRALRAELIRREIVLALNEAESVGRDHVVKVTFTLADRAIAFTYPRELGSDLKLDATAVARASIGFYSGVRRHTFLLASNDHAQRKG